jgi:hypothetical protein
LKVVIGGMLGDAFARTGMFDQARQIAEMIKPLADRMNSEPSCDGILTYLWFGSMPFRQLWRNLAKICPGAL